MTAHNLPVSALAFQAEFFPLGRPLRIAANEPEVIRQAARLWSRYPQLSEANPVHLNIFVSSGNGTPFAQPLCRIAGNRVSFHAGPCNRAVADLGLGAASAIFTADFMSDLESWRYHFLEPLGYVLIAARHFTLLHAACVVRRRRALLLCGDSGAGKTCLAYAAARKGWSFLSGDATAVVRNAPAVLVVGRPFELRFRHTAAAVFPELRKFLPALRPNGKLDIELDPAAVRIPTAIEAPAAAVVMLRRTRMRGAFAEPAARDECQRLLQSSICFGDAALRRQQMQTLEKVLDLPLYLLQYSDVDAAEQTLRRLVPGGSRRRFA